MGGKILLIEDDEEEGLIMAQDSSPDIVLLDWTLPNLSGIEICRRLRKKIPLKIFQSLYSQPGPVKRTGLEALTWVLMIILRNPFLPSNWSPVLMPS